MPNPMCHFSSRSTSSIPSYSPGNCVLVEDLQQRVLAGGEDHALQDHVVEPDRFHAGLGSGLRQPALEDVEELGGHVRARIVEPDGLRVAGEEARVALLVDALGLERRGGVAVEEGVQVLGDARFADDEARDELLDARVGGGRPVGGVDGEVDGLVVPLDAVREAQEMLVSHDLHGV